MENNKYLLVMMAAKRAKELKKGAKPLVESKHRKPTVIALEEIKAGKVYLKEKEEPLKAEDVFHDDEGFLKVEEPEKPEELSNEDKKLAKVEEIFNEDGESEKSEG
jgi:DNA-directed RNA polymerase omega subunit